MADKFYRVKQLSRPNPNSVKARLPLLYKKYVEALKENPSPVHYIPEIAEWKISPHTKERVRVENRAVPLKFPEQADKGIWGGEGVIQGFTKEKRLKRRYPNYWVPKLKRTVVYSEILNEYMHMTVTERTLKLIDQNFGFDHYILGSRVCDLKSQLAFSIRRKMLLALVNEEKYHKDEATNQEVFEKYKKYMIPKEEAEWFGLTEREAVQKQKLIEDAEPAVPLKHRLRLQLIQEFKSAQESGDSGDITGEAEETKSSYLSWLSRLNPFMRNTK